MGHAGGSPRSQLLLKTPTLASFDLLPSWKAERWLQLWAPCEGSDRTRCQKEGEPAGQAAAPRRDGAVGLLPVPPGGHLWGLQGRGSRGHGTSLREKEERQEGRKESHALLGRTRLEPSAPGGPGAAVAPAAPLLDQFHVVGGEHAEVAVGAVAPPPALVDHLDVGDDVLRVKRDLSVVSWKETEGG